MKETTKIISTLLGFIPPEYHHPPDLTMSIEEAWQSILDQEDGIHPVQRSVVEEIFTDEEWNYPEDRRSRRQARDVITVLVAFRAGEEEDYEMLTTLRLAADTEEEFNQINHAFMAGDSESQPDFFPPDTYESYKDVILDLILGNLERVKDKYLLAKNSYGKMYEDQIVAMVEAFLEDGSNVLTRYRLYSGFLRYIKRS